MDIQNMMKQAQLMQDQLQHQMGDLRVEGSAGGGMVRVVVTGHKQLSSIALHPDVVSKDDIDMLQDLILTAVNDAHRKVDADLKQKMGGLMGGLGLPGM